MEANMTLAVGVDNKNNIINIMEKFNKNHSKIYLELAKRITENLGPAVLNYSITFEDRKYTNILELADSIVALGKEEINKIINPEPDKTHYSELLIEDIDYAKKEITFNEKATLKNMIVIIKSIPTLLCFSVKQKDKVYKNVSEIAKEEFSHKEYTEGLIIGLTNSFLDDAAAEVKKEG